MTNTGAEATFMQVVFSSGDLQRYKFQKDFRNKKTDEGFTLFYISQ